MNQNILNPANKTGSGNKLKQGHLIFYKMSYLNYAFKIVYIKEL